MIVEGWWMGRGLVTSVTDVTASSYSIFRLFSGQNFLLDNSTKDGFRNSLPFSAVCKNYPSRIFV